MILGYSGSRFGMQVEQCLAFCRLLAELKPKRLLTGKCLGGDVQAQKLAEAMFPGIEVWHYPSNRTEWTALDLKAHWTDDPTDPLSRNWKIVRACEVLVAAPREMTEQPRGGTWATARYARKVARRMYLLLPDGTIEKENAPLEGAR